MHEILNCAGPLDQHSLSPYGVSQRNSNWGSVRVQANRNADDGVAWPRLVDAVAWDVAMVYLLAWRAVVQRPFDHIGEGRLLR